MDGSFLDKLLYFLIMFVLLVGFFAFMDNDPDAPKEAIFIITAAIPITVLRWANRETLLERTIATWNLF